MKNFKKGILFLIITTLVTLAISGCAGVSLSKAHSAYANSSAFSTKKRMRAFRSDQEIKSYFHELAEKMQREQGRRGEGMPMESQATSNTGIAQPAPAMGAVENKVGTAAKDE